MQVFKSIHTWSLVTQRRGSHEISQPGYEGYTTGEALLCSVAKALAQSFGVEGTDHDSKECNREVG